jgi:hypothetical protein
MSRYFLFALPSFFGGMARVLDLGGTLKEFNYSPSPERADYIALKSDWSAIGSDVWTAMHRHVKAAGDGEE